MISAAKTAHLLQSSFTPREYIIRATEISFGHCPSSGVYLLYQERNRSNFDILKEEEECSRTTLTMVPW